MSYIADRVSHFGVTIFTEMTALAQKHQAVNLGQGFPDFPAPDFVKEAAARAIHNNVNQYAPRNGLPQLREAIAHKVSKHDGLEVTADAVTITHGATEAIFATIMGLVNPGDEVILFEPYYDSYIPSVEFAGGTPRFYTLSAPDWHIDPAALEALFNNKTKLIVINTPHNPTGKVYSREELQLIADLCQKYDVIAVVDSVYEHIVFDEAKHYTLATFPGMKERTVTISSFGKTFSVTGWKIGWTIAPAELTQGIVSGHQFITFCSVAPLQAAAAEIFSWAERTGYYEKLAAMYAQKRDFLLETLDGVGLPTIRPRGTYFAMVDISELGFANDVDFCRYLTTEVGVAAIPPSAFYQNPADGATVARFTFCKTDEALREAAVRLARWRQ